MRHTIRHSFLLCSMLFVFAANPGYFGCSEEEDFGFGESDMRTYIEGTWAGAITFSDGTTTPYTLELQQSAQAMSSSALCGQRSFIRAAAACVAMSSMPVSGTLTTDDGRYTAQPVDGQFEVMGAEFDNGYLSLNLGNGTSLSTSGSGTSFDGGTVYGDGASEGSFTIGRMTR